MENFNYIYEKFFNLGVFSRVLLIIVKPLTLWLSIKLDADAGLAVAQIYLIGLLFISLSGTNAHRVFYQKYFGVKKLSFNKNVARLYIEYIQKITLQLFVVIIVSSLIACLVFWGSFDIVVVGILFGIAEKLNDEFQRYAQFCNNSKSLFYLALSKLVPVLVSTLLSYLLIIDIRFAFPVLLLIGSILINWQSFQSAICYLVKTIKKSFFVIVKKSFNFIRQDIFQIGCVFLGISLVSIDKWLLQYFSTTDLPMYMLYTQLASVFIVTQTIVLIAPVRARLVNENPGDIKAIKIGSPIISLIPLCLGIVLYYYDDYTRFDLNIGCFAFFFAAIVTFTVPYTERLYWATTAGIRLALDAVISIIFILTVIVLTIFWSSPNLIFLSLIALFSLLCLRVLIMIKLLNKTKMHKI